MRDGVAPRIFLFFTASLRSRRALKFRWSFNTTRRTASDTGSPFRSRNCSREKLGPLLTAEFSDEFRLEGVVFVVRVLPGHFFHPMTNASSNAME